MIHSGFDAPFARDFPVACRTWAEYARRAEQHRSEHSDRCLEVRHEELVSDPEGLFDRILAFLEASPHEAPADFARKERINSSYGSRSSGDAKAKERKEIPREPWSEWSKQQWHQFQRIAGAAMAELGFDWRISP